MRIPKEERRSKSPRRLYKSDEYLGLCPSEIDWARLAAFIDGEGSINFSPRRTNTGKSLTLCGRIQIANTDVRLALWLNKTFGMNFHSGREGINDRWKTCYWAQACSYRACWIALHIMPWLIIKREQAELILQHQETMGSWQRGSGIKTPSNVLEFRSKLHDRMRQLNHRGPKVAAREVS